MVNTPVLFITFARPEYACHSFAAIKRAQPKKLYFYSNKARDDRSDEVMRNEEVRSYVKQIDWDCEVKTWFREEYVDIYTSLWGAMDWLFDNEEQGIVLEEDCVASLSFFEYCEKMLGLYKNEKRISIISGNNRTPQYSPKGVDCFLSCQVDIYGWASWKDRWMEATKDRTLKEWPRFRKQLHKYFGQWPPALWYGFWWHRMYKRIDTFNPWDSITSYNRVRCNTYGLIPVCNLVKDIGKVGVHHAISTSGVSALDYEIGDVGDLYKNSEFHPLELSKYYEKKHFMAIMKRDFKYTLVKLFSHK